jgi:UPF0755 protein
MKRLLFLPLLIVIVIATVAIWFYESSKPVTSAEKFSYFVIARGTPASQVGTKLKSAGLIKNALAFKVYLQFTGQSGKLQAGEYKLTPSYSLFQVVSTFSKGPVELWVTVPEGLRREEVAQKFALTLGKDNAFVADFLKASQGKEGYLFPDTYLFPRDASVSAIVGEMTDTFVSKTKNLVNNSGLSFDQAIILASLLERETKTDAERPIVAGILIKRLEAGWPLQTDASVQYAVGTPADWWPILTLDDLSIKSPYNTYKNRGLPPTPIAGPGLSSIKAALNPTESGYWYYIHDTSGQIHYAETISEQNANIAKYLGK